MSASRYVEHFRSEVTHWQRTLANISDVVAALGDIQRTWSYLEPLFIGSEVCCAASRGGASHTLS